MRNSLMDRDAGNEIDAILTHPRHQWALNTMIGLIHDLRQCVNDEDLYQFQDRLFPLVMDADERRGQVSRVIKRLRAKPGKLPRDAPELGINGDPLDLESWKLEEEVLERVARQLRSIGDALAWRAFGYDRRIIVALSRGMAAGPMNGKTGTAAERAFVRTSWDNDGQFVLHHDLTNVLRIGDGTIFHKDGGATLREIKTNEKVKDSRQDSLRNGTQRALAEGTVLPSGFHLLESGYPYRTDLDGLREVLDLAARRTGIQGAVLSTGRAIITANQLTATSHYTADSFGERILAESERFRKKIHAAVPNDVLSVWSLDLVGRSATRPPWGIYPLAADIAACLIADAIFFVVLMSTNAIVAALAEAGVASHWLQPLDRPVDLDQSLLAVASTARLDSATKVVWSSLNPEAIFSLMLEMVNLSTWSNQVAWSLRQDVGHDERPWPLFKNEGRVWF